MIRASIAVAALALSAAVTPGFAGSSDSPPPSAAPPATNRLMIINGHSGRVVYDDGIDDQFCVIRRHVVGWYDDGRRIIRRTLSCR